MPDATHADRVAELPPSAKLVYKCLQLADEDGTGMSAQEIAEWTYLPVRTVRTGIDRLREEDVVERRPEVLGDTRSFRYLIVN